MYIIEEIVLIILYTTLVYLVNKYVVPWFVKELILMNNSAWLERNKSRIIKGYQYFFGTVIALYVLSRIYFIAIGVIK